MTDLVNKKTGYIQFTLGQIMDCDNEYVVYDGSDYISFSKKEFVLINYNNLNHIHKIIKEMLVGEI